ncbi:MAG: hypothetical protein E5V25_22520 [Mesorhizobium sp.]|uniref:hypothetical protein n=1 Tax=unclassified Mesorhizobium TaxID=325217 RepID=UPI000FE507EE|nr:MULTISPECIES: hypothetical protein [unclassified Mesorhizobium]RWB28675.1 MAG: hypothetical protein EOQ43_22535 [Mesorhizobium sp.]RWB36006.1 MAG: hypothetical protein EOQ41_02385 [Mesorhizobium sp.]RWB81384.1 MAG: hypothetical protein EOQ42_02715 [Mesorhizobium sp.]RWC23150.1 MAG: hypothetical protein EOS51_08420 [Mesorhizobium sp.]RWD22505.1 MAG: hypothetical protein EOS57_02870 [Mesorhizobium sp.]
MTVVMLPALYVMLHGNPALEPIVATDSMIVRCQRAHLCLRGFLHRNGALSFGNTCGSTLDGIEMC